MAVDDNIKSDTIGPNPVVLSMSDPSRPPTAGSPVSRRLFAVNLLAFVMISLACNLVNRRNDLAATITAISGVETELAATQLALLTTATAAAGGPTSESLAVATEPLPTLPGVEPATAAATSDPANSNSPGSNPDERLMKSARILLFEDMSASRHIRLVKEALDRNDYFYLDVGSAKGWFKNQLLSGQEWDLVIAAAEAERDFGGEFFEYLDAHVGKGGAAVIETWDLDSAPRGMARPLLDRCGLQVQLDWFEPNLRVFYWTDPAHPLFNHPNVLAGGLRNAPALWQGDLGDLMAVGSNGAEGAGRILASTNPNWLTDHGLLAECEAGRLILQTFRSHEYHHDDIVALWQNYVEYALRARFSYTGQAPPPIPPTQPAQTGPVPEITREATPGPDYSFPHPCGLALTVRLTRAPQFQPDLFEHHALGTFMILRLELVNSGTQPIQVWDGDYGLEAVLSGNPVFYVPQRAATGYLFIDGGGELYQDLIQPGETWRTSVAFDVDPAAGEWVLTLRPGFEFNQTACEARIPLTR